MKLSANERKAKRVFEKAVKYWRKVLLIDPIWTFKVEVVEDDEMGCSSANVNIGSAEYYIACVGIARGLLSEEENLEAVASHVACHEMLHIATADYQRAAVTAAGENYEMQEELRYRYEQLVSRLSMILECYDGGCNCGSDCRTSSKMLQLPAMPVGNENG